MKPYKNLSGTAQITHYEITKRGIRVWFQKGKKNPYHYLSEVEGRAVISKMIALAEAGRGLSTFIAQNRLVLKPSAA